MCKGAFGGVNSLTSSTEPHEYICVQSMDGMLSVFEYESFSLSCFLPKVLIPGPFKYMPKTDSFITVNSSWELESYKYQILATSATTLERKNNENSNAKQKKILPEFTYNLGEAALDIDIVLNSSSTSSCSILVLGERNLYCFSDSCVLRYMKKFDYNPSCFCAYPIISSSSEAINSGSGNAKKSVTASALAFIMLIQCSKFRKFLNLMLIQIKLWVILIQNMKHFLTSLIGQIVLFTKMYWWPE